MAFDTLIRGGRVLDGTGAPARMADVGIRDGKIAAVGDVDGRADRVIDADGALVTPGLVDIHTHYDGQATWAERMSPSSHHGVTTVVMGNCGVGFAPVRASDHELLVQLMEGVEDIPGAALHEGLTWDWESFPDYLDYLGERRFDMDIGTQLPHGALRVYVMGQRGADREPATPEDIARMRELTEEAIRAGALGFSSSRTLNHRSSTGDPTPSLTAERDELLGIAAGVRAAGRGVIELISDFDGLDGEFDLLETMARESTRPMSISLAQGISVHGWRKLMAKIDGANARGTRIRGQVAPRAIGILLGLPGSVCPFMTHPTYRRYAELPVAERVRELARPEVRAAILREEPSPNFKLFANIMANFDKVWVLNDPPEYEPAPENSIGAQARASGQDPWALAYDTMLEDGGTRLMYTPFANYTDNNLDCCREMILAPNTVMGLGDGGAHVGTICDASYPTYLLTHWGRDRTRGEGIALETLVRAQTRDTARAVGLTDRGTLEPGMRADVNVIDFDNLRVRAPRIVNDLPAGGARLEQRADGYLHTFVAGEETYRGGEATDALPGRLVRG
ncbi:MAG: amidohydrolase family protein [Pseudomonadota bacterium]